MQLSLQAAMLLLVLLLNIGQLHAAVGAGCLCHGQWVWCCPLEQCWTSFTGNAVDGFGLRYVPAEGAANDGSRQTGWSMNLSVFTMELDVVTTVRGV